MIGEGTKIDNLVQIGHNVEIGRHCVLVAQTGISGSCTIEDYVMLGGRVGLTDNVTIGAGAMIAATGVMAMFRRRALGRRAGQPVKEWFQSVAAVRKRRAGDERRAAGGDE